LEVAKGGIMDRDCQLTPPGSVGRTTQLRAGHRRDRSFSIGSSSAKVSDNTEEKIEVLRKYVKDTFVSVLQPRLKVFFEAAVSLQDTQSAQSLVQFIRVAKAELEKMRGFITRKKLPAPAPVPDKLNALRNLLAHALESIRSGLSDIAKWATDSRLPDLDPRTIIGVVKSFKTLVALVASTKLPHIPILNPGQVPQITLTVDELTRARSQIEADVQLYPPIPSQSIGKNLPNAPTVPATEDVKSALDDELSALEGDLASIYPGYEQQQEEVKRRALEEEQILDEIIAEEAVHHGEDEDEQPFDEQRSPRPEFIAEPDHDENSDDEKADKKKGGKSNKIVVKKKKKKKNDKIQFLEDREKATEKKMVKKSVIEKRKGKLTRNRSASFNS